MGLTIVDLRCLSFIDINITNHLSIIASDFNVQSGDGGEVSDMGVRY